MNDDHAAPGDGTSEGRSGQPGVVGAPAGARRGRSSAGDSLRAEATTPPSPASGPRRRHSGDRGVATLSKGLAAIRRVRRDLRRRLSRSAGDGLHGTGWRAAGGRAVDRPGGADRVRRAGLLAGAVGRSRVDDRPDGRHGDRTACRSRPRSGSGIGRHAQPDRGRMVPARTDRAPRRDRRSALPAAARRLSRRCGRADGRWAVGQDDRHDRRGRQPRRSARSPSPTSSTTRTC